MMDVGGDAPGVPPGLERPEATAIPGSAETAGRMADLFLEGTLG